jgi:hypothetical protein
VEKKDIKTGEGLFISPTQHTAQEVGASVGVDFMSIRSPDRANVSPPFCSLRKGKSIMTSIRLLPLQGAIYSVIYHLPRALPWAGISLALQAAFAQNPSVQDERIG